MHLLKELLHKKRLISIIVLSITVLLVTGFAIRPRHKSACLFVTPVGQCYTQQMKDEDEATESACRSEVLFKDPNATKQDLDGCDVAR